MATNGPSQERHRLWSPSGLVLLAFLDSAGRLVRRRLGQAVLERAEL